MKITEGTRVCVNFNNAQFTLVRNGLVENKPRATGDCWRIRDLDNGITHCISEGCTISTLPEEGEG